MKKVLVLVLAVAVAGAAALQAEGPMIYKDPMASLIFSAAAPGVGQLYCTKYKRATFILLTEAVLAACAAYPMAQDSYVEYEVTDLDGNPVTVAGHKKRDWDDLSKSDRRQVIGCGLAVLGVYIWNLFDAYEQAGEYNKQLLERSGPVASLQAGKLTAGWQASF